MYFDNINIQWKCELLVLRNFLCLVDRDSETHYRENDSFQDRPSKQFEGP